MPVGPTGPARPHAVLEVLIFLLWDWLLNAVDLWLAKVDLEDVIVIEPVLDLGMVHAVAAHGRSR